MARAASSTGRARDRCGEFANHLLDDVRRCRGKRDIGRAQQQIVGIAKYAFRNRRFRRINGPERLLDLIALVDHHAFSGVVDRRNGPKKINGARTQGADFIGRSCPLDTNDDLRAARQCRLEFVLHLNQGLVVLRRH